MDVRISMAIDRTDGIKKALDRFKLGVDADSEQRTREIDALRFQVPELSWPNDVKEQRKPQLVGGVAGDLVDTKLGHVAHWDALSARRSQIDIVDSCCRRPSLGTPAVCGSLTTTVRFDGAVPPALGPTEIV